MEGNAIEIGTAVPTQGPRLVDMDVFAHSIAQAATGGVEEIASALQRFRPTWDSTQDWVRLREGRYTRSLVYRDESVEILVLTWARGAGAPVHDHAKQRCWMMGVRGALELTDYHLVKGGREPGEAVLTPASPTRLLEPGELDMRPPGDDVHSVRCARGDDMAVSVHVYAAPIQRCLIYDLRRQRCEEKRLRYDFIGPRRPREGFTGTAKALKGHAPEFGAKGFFARFTRKARESAEDLLVPAVPSNDADCALTANTLSVDYGGRSVIDGANLSVRRGELLAVLGPSGCGKTSLLRALGGEVEPTSGTVKLRGDGRRCLYVGGEHALFPWFSVAQNLDLVLGSNGVARAERPARIRELLRLVQLDGFDEAMPHQLSSGMKLRASLARALAIDVDVLLLDDPFAGLDPGTRRQMEQVIVRAWAARGNTVVLVTSDAEEAVAVATRVVVLSSRPAKVLAELDVNLPAGAERSVSSIRELAESLRERLAGTLH